MVAVETFHHRRRPAIRLQKQKHGLATTGTRFAQRVAHAAVLNSLRPRVRGRAQSLKLIPVPKDFAWSQPTRGEAQRGRQAQLLSATDARMPLPVVMRLENERHQGKAWYFGAEQEIVQENVDGTVRAWGCGSVERADANLVDRTQFARDPRDRPSQHIRGP